jgi:signal recognition particle GTPase
VTEWIISAAAVIVFLLLMPAMVRSSRRSRRGRGSGAAVADVLMGAFDPAKQAAIEQIRKQKEIGDHERGAVGEKLD